MSRKIDATSSASVRCYYISRFGPLLFGPVIGEFEFHRDRFYLNGEQHRCLDPIYLSLVMRSVLSVKFDGKTLYLLTRRGGEIFRKISNQ